MVFCLKRFIFNFGNLKEEKFGRHERVLHFNKIMCLPEKTKQSILDELQLFIFMWDR